MSRIDAIPGGTSSTIAISAVRPSRRGVTSADSAPARFASATVRAHARAWRKTVRARETINAAATRWPLRAGGRHKGRRRAHHRDVPAAALSPRAATRHAGPRQTGLSRNGPLPRDPPRDARPRHDPHRDARHRQGRPPGEPLPPDRPRGARHRPAPTAPVAVGLRAAAAPARAAACADWRRLHYVYLRSCCDASILVPPKQQKFAHLMRNRGTAPCPHRVDLSPC